MSKSGRIKNKVVQATIQNKDVLDMFHGVLGTGGAALNIAVVYPKYQKITEHCGRFICLLEALRDSPVMRHFPTETSHLAGYISTLQKGAAAVFRAPDFATLHPPGPSELLSGKLADYSAVTREEYDTFAEIYQSLKDSNLVSTIIVTCKNLVSHKKSLSDQKDLKDRFLVKTAGLSFTPLPGLPAMNFKQIYISDQLSSSNRHFVLMVLHKMLTVSHDVYDTMSSPDIDVDEFVQVIMASLDDVKKQIPRCDEAFNKIVDSVSLLKDNFGGYYKDYVASNNPTIIMENFVLDVSKSTKSSSQVTTQFRRIIAHYRKIASQQANHPKLKTLFQQVDRNFQELEKRSQKAGQEKDDEDGEDGEDGDGAAGGEEALPAEEAAARKKREKNRKKRERQHRRKAEQQLEAMLGSMSTEKSLAGGRSSPELPPLHLSELDGPDAADAETTGVSADSADSGDDDTAAVSSESELTSSSHSADESADE